MNRGTGRGVSVLSLLALAPVASAFEVRLASSNFVTTAVFSDVTFFTVTIDIDGPLQAGVYSNPTISQVVYQVTGDLVAGTPSGFPAFDLQRTISGTDFYAQGSSLSFEIPPGAALSDGVQVGELVGANVVFTFNGREVDNGRFHPALLELNADGTGRIQNSNNVPTQNPLVEVDFGEEYITDLMFDPGNLTIIAQTGGLGGGGSSSSAVSGWTLILLFGVTVLRRRSLGRISPLRVA